MSSQPNQPRIMPFITALDRHDIVEVLAKFPLTERVFRETGTGENDAEVENGKNASAPDSKISKDSKDSKDFKDSKDWKDGSDLNNPFTSGRSFSSIEDDENQREALSRKQEKQEIFIGMQGGVQAEEVDFEEMNAESMLTYNREVISQLQESRL